MGYERLNLKTGQVITEEVFTHLEDGIEGASVLMTPILYADLVALRDAGQLKAGMFYRITDYVTTTIQENTQSAGHAFDVIVMATDNKTLSEEARACRREFDIEKYKDAYSNTWGEKMLYIGTQEYKGKDYHLYESESQDLQMLVDFSRRLVEYTSEDDNYPFIYFPSYTRELDGSDWVDGQNFSEVIQFKYEDPNYFDSCNLAAWKVWYCLDNDAERFAWADAENGKGVIYRLIDEWNNDCPYDFKNVIYNKAETAYVLYNPPWNASLIFGAILTRDATSDTTIDGDSYYAFKSVIFHGPGIQTVVYAKDENISDGILYTITDNIPSVSTNVFLKKTVSATTQYTFGNNDTHEDYSLTNCKGNILRDFVVEGILTLPFTSFGNNCSYNSFGNNCYFNSFGNSCSYNCVGNNCSSNSFGNSCYSNSFGNGCNTNSFGNDCNANSFGDVCSHNSFCDSDGETIPYCCYNQFGNYCQNVKLLNDSTASGSSRLQNIRVASGCTGTVEVARGLEYETTIAKATDGTIKQFNLADLAN